MPFGVCHVIKAALGEFGDMAFKMQMLVKLNAEVS